MTLLACLLTAVAVVGYLRRERLLSWLVDRVGREPPPVELVELDDDVENAWDQIVAHYGREAR